MRPDASFLKNRGPVILSLETDDDSRLEFAARGQVSIEIGYSRHSTECYVTLMSALTRESFEYIRDLPGQESLCWPVPLSSRRVVGIPALTDIRNAIDAVILAARQAEGC